MKTIEMEIALAKHFNIRKNIIVPNVSWGLWLNNAPLHECDLLLLTKSGYLWEVEIKISRGDLIADKKKTHAHYHPSIKRLYFAIPDYLSSDIKHIPERAGVIIVEKKRTRTFCKVIREPEIQKGYQLNDKEKFKLARLGTMRSWTLKKNLLKQIIEKMEA